MAVMSKHVRNGDTVQKRPIDLFDTLFSDWPTMFRRPFVVVPEGLDTIRADGEVAIEAIASYCASGSKLDTVRL